MTVTTDHLALGNFSLNGIQRPALFCHREYATAFDAMYVVEVENTNVSVSAVDACMNPKVIVEKLSTLGSELHSMSS